MVQLVAPAMFLVDENDTYDSWRTKMEEYRKAVYRKWAWLIEGTPEMKASPYFKPVPQLQKLNLAMLLENQQACSQGIIQEATTTTDFVLPVRQALPLVRRLYPDLFALKICSIQPMAVNSGGVSQAFYLDFYRENVSPNTSLTVSDSDYSRSAENAVPKTVRMTVTGVQIGSTKDQLAAVWSSEAAEDARGVLGLDVERELLLATTDEIRREIDERIMYTIVNGATGGSADWDANNTTTWPDDKYAQTLGHAMQHVELEVFQKRYKTCGFALCGSTAYEYVSRMQGFEATGVRPDGAANISGSVGINHIGTYQKRWDIYLTPYTWMTTKILMGVYPSQVSALDAGFIWAPYVPITPMPLVYAEMKSYNDPVQPGQLVLTDKWTRNVRTRNGQHYAVPDLFGIVEVTPEE